MLKVEDVHTYYGQSYVLQGISLNVSAGEAVAILGRNSTGKSTTLKTILGIAPPARGEIVFNGHDLTRYAAYRIPRFGIGYVPQNSVVFPRLTVRENLEIGAVKSGGQMDNMEEIFEMFPRVREQLAQQAGVLSGGQRQMVAIARAMIGNPGLILFDEPTAGLMPKAVGEVGDMIASIVRRGVAVLLVEQNVQVGLRVCERLYIMERGRVKYDGLVSSLSEEKLFQYLGV